MLSPESAKAIVWIADEGYSTGGKVAVDSSVHVCTCTSHTVEAVAQQSRWLVLAAQRQHQ